MKNDTRTSKRGSLFSKAVKPTKPNMDTKLKTIYEEVQTCPMSETCLQSCRKKDHKVSLRPQKNLWVGADYHSGRIMIVGINRNIGGKYIHLENEIENWVGGMIQELKEFRQGKSGKDYWLKHVKPMVERFLGRKMKDDNEAFQHIAFTESVKCSPDWPLSLPSNQMNKNCMNTMGYLKREIEILKPKLIIALGSGNARLIHGIYDSNNGKRL